MSEDEATETPMTDHIARFWHLLRTENVHVVVNIRREHDEGNPPHWDSSSFGNDVAKALAASPAPLDGWRDITTAPKDGRKILLADYSGFAERHEAGVWITSAHWYVFNDDGWWTDGVERLYTPTHWQPLPSPPSSNSPPSAGEDIAGLVKETLAKDVHVAAESVTAGWNAAIKECANIANAIDSGRGNEKEIARAVLSLLRGGSNG